MKNLVKYKQDNQYISPKTETDMTTSSNNDLNQIMIQNDSYSKYDNNCQNCSGGGNNISNIIDPLNNILYDLNTIKGTEIIKYYIYFSLNKINNTSYNFLIIDGKKYETKSLEGLKKIKYLMIKYIKPTIKK